MGIRVQDAQSKFGVMLNQTVGGEQGLAQAARDGLAIKLDVGQQWVSALISITPY